MEVVDGTNVHVVEAYTDLEEEAVSPRNSMESGMIPGNSMESGMIPEETKMTLSEALWKQREAGDLTDLVIYGQAGCAVKGHKALLAFNHAALGAAFADRAAGAQEEDVTVIIAPDFDESVILKDLEKAYLMFSPETEIDFDLFDCVGDRRKLVTTEVEETSSTATVVLPAMPTLPSMTTATVLPPNHHQSVHHQESPQSNMFFKTDQIIVKKSQESSHRMVRLSALKRKKKAVELEQVPLGTLNQNMIKCHLCDWKCLEEKQLETHHFKVHEPMANCIMCGEQVKVSMLGKHTSGHFDDKVTAAQNSAAKKRRKMAGANDENEDKLCEICDKVFPIAEFSGHAMTHAPNKWNFGCQECDLVFKDDRSLKNHQAKKHETQHKCDQCPKDMPGFGTAEKLEDHVTKCHSEGSFICDLCEHVSPTYKYFEKHMKTHIKTDEVTGRLYCQFCSKEIMRTKNKSKPFGHMFTHINPEYFQHQCSFCDQKFYSGTKKREHENVYHTGKLDWVCPLCGEGFQTSARRAVHKQKCKKSVEHQGKDDITKAKAKSKNTEEND